MTELQKSITSEYFASIFARMASQLRWLDYRPADTESYFAALRDLPEDIIHESAKRIANEPGRKYFPTTGEWRAWAVEIETENERKALEGVRREWKLECEDCEDTGWIFRECPSEHCGRDRPHAPHRFVRVCGCRESNHTFQRHHPKRVSALA